MVSGDQSKYLFIQAECGKGPELVMANSHTQTLHNKVIKNMGTLTKTTTRSKSSKQLEENQCDLHTLIVLHQNVQWLSSDFNKLELIAAEIPTVMEHWKSC